jgi:hypothetical protein
LAPESRSSSFEVLHPFNSEPGSVIRGRTLLLVLCAGPVIEHLERVDGGTFPLRPRGIDGLQPDVIRLLRFDLLRHDPVARTIELKETMGVLHRRHLGKVIGGNDRFVICLRVSHGQGIRFDSADGQEENDCGKDRSAEQIGPYEDHGMSIIKEVEKKANFLYA